MRYALPENSIRQGGPVRVLRLFADISDALNA